MQDFLKSFMKIQPLKKKTARSTVTTSSEQPGQKGQNAKGKKKRKKRGTSWLLTQLETKTKTKFAFKNITKRIPFCFGIKEQQDLPE